MNNESMNVAPVDEKLPVGKSLALALQHVLAMCAGAVAVPIIVGNAAGLSQSDIVFFNKCRFTNCRSCYLNSNLRAWF